MNKKLLSLAIGAALGAAPLFAQADVVVYGQLGAEIANEDTDTGPYSLDGRGIQGLNRSDDNAVTVNGVTMEDNKRGRLGIKASEKLANGMTAIAKFEWQVDTTDGNITDGQRDSYVGLKGNFGEVQFGSLKGAYKYTGGVTYDPFVTTNMEARRYGGMLTGVFGTNAFLRNSIGYMTPSFGGLKGWVTYSPDEGSSNNGRGTDKGDWTASLKYDGGNWEAFVAGTQDNADGETAINGGTGVSVTPNPLAAGSGDFTAWKVGGKYKLGNHTFLAQYEDAEDDATGVDKIKIFFVGYHLQMGNNTFVAQYGDSTVEYDASASSDQEGQYYALGLIHKMSKKTRVYGGYRKTEVDNAGGVAGSNPSGDVWSLGMRVDF